MTMFLLNKNNKIIKGFTLIELLVVIAIIGILSTLAVVALSNARAKSRDSKRVADIKQISTALELYFADNNSYPTIITPGNSLASPDGSKVYLTKIPSNPTPRNDSGCGNNDYTYASTSDNTNYSLNFCLGNSVASTPAGINSTSNVGIGTAPGLVDWWRFEETSGASIYDVGTNNNTCSVQGSQAKIDIFRGGTSTCRLGYCGQFDGSNELYVNCGTSDSLVVNSGTISLWFRASASISGNNNRLVEIGNSSGTQRIGLFFGASKITLYGVKDNSAILSTSTAVISTNTWYYLAGTWGSNGGYIYIKNANFDNNNGALGDRTMALPQGSTRLFIGNFIAGSAGYTWNGDIDDVRIYNRALSADEILAIYNSTKP